MHGDEGTVGSLFGDADRGGAGVICGDGLHFGLIAEQHAEGLVELVDDLREIMGQRLAQINRRLPAMLLGVAQGVDSAGSLRVAEQGVATDM